MLLMPAHNTHTHDEIKTENTPTHFAPPRLSSHTAAEMVGGDMRIILLKIMRVRQWTQAQLAHELKTTQPTISRLLAGAEAKDATRRKILTLARKLGVLTNISLETLEYIQGVPIVATVGAAGELRMLPQEQQELAPRPPGAAANTIVAAQVIGTGMLPMLDDGWTIYWDSGLPDSIEKLIGCLCVVALVGGQLLVRKLYKGRSKDRYDLHAVNAQPLQDQPLDWAAKVIWIAPK
jgi:transcriptional regulator with XRE-family HTH domain